MKIGKEVVVVVGVLISSFLFVIVVKRKGNEEREGDVFRKIVNNLFILFLNCFRVLSTENKLRTCPRELIRSMTKFHLRHLKMKVSNLFQFTFS